MSESEYWLVGKMDYVNRFGTMERIDDQILIVSIPMDIRRGLDRKDIMLSDLEALSRANVDNIFLNEDYPPFQRYQTLNDVYVGCPIVFTNGNTKNLLRDLLAINSKRFYDYKKVVDDYETLTKEQLASPNP